MDWIIELLEYRLKQMDEAYCKYISNNNVCSPNAAENREKAEQLSEAIKILKNHKIT